MEMTTKPTGAALRQHIHSSDFINIYATDPSATLCEEIIQHAETNQWATSQIATSLGKDNFDSEQVDLVARDSQQQSYASRYPPDVHGPMLAFSSECLNAYLKTFPMADKFPRFAVVENYQVLRYFDGGAYHAVHSDYSPVGMMAGRHLTGITFLNDVAKGGELLFPHQNFSVKPEAGKFVIFPSGWTHAHKTMPPVGQSRYVFQMWWGFPQ